MVTVDRFCFCYETIGDSKHVLLYLEYGYGGIQGGIGSEA